MSNFNNKIKNNFSKNLSEMTEQIFCAYYFSPIIKKNKIYNTLYQNKLSLKKEQNTNLNFTNFTNSRNNIGINYLNMYKNYCINVQHRVFVYIDKFGNCFFLGAGTHSLGISDYNGFNFKDINGRILYPYYIKNLKLSDCIFNRSIDPKLNLLECKQYLFLLSKMKEAHCYAVKDYSMEYNSICILANRLNLKNLPFILKSYKKIQFDNISEKQIIVKNHELSSFKIEFPSNGSYIEKKTTEILNVYKHINIDDIHYYKEIIF